VTQNAMRKDAMIRSRSAWHLGESMVIAALALSVGAAAMAQTPCKSPAQQKLTVALGYKSDVFSCDGMIDPLLVMQQELARERPLLKLPGLQAPYFIEYRLEDIDSYSATASYGSLASEDQQRQRLVRVEVRIGDAASDSSSARGEGSLSVAPLANDAEALRYALWSATDEAYKAALNSYAAKQAALKNFQTPPTANDFSPAAAEIHIEPVVSLDLDRTAWRSELTEASGLYATDPAVKSFAATIQYSNAQMRAFAVTRSIVNTEGSAIRRSYAGYALNISLGGQADDGMDLGRSNGSVATTAAGLESWPKFRARVIADLESYNALRHAPKFDEEDYHGPVLFSGDAAADVMSTLFQPNVEADRPEMGTTARTRGVYQSSLHSLVLPPFMSVRDQPSLAEFNGQQLVGSYAVDDEGVPAQTVPVVVDGKLENFLIGREPVKDFPQSNGHGRAGLGQAAHSRAGVLVVSVKHPETQAQLEARLLAVARREHRDVYEVETLADELTPRVLYRVSPSGKRTLIRGAQFDELDQRSLRTQVIAAGSDPYVAQSLFPVPQSLIVPSLLFGDIAVRRSTDQNGKLPYYAPPAKADSSE
jgi:TldD protein